jgi:hypothetical protein
VTHVHLLEGTVRLELARWERFFAGGRARYVVPLPSIERAEVVDRPTAASATPGGRAGLVVLGVLKVGRWGIGTGRRRFVSVRRGVPGLRLVLGADAAAELGYDELLVSTPDAASVAAGLPMDRRR